jgi:hypothetical protein
MDSTHCHTDKMYHPGAANAPGAVASAVPVPENSRWASEAPQTGVCAWCEPFLSPNLLCSACEQV